MNTSPEITKFLSETKVCAMQMLSNAVYIQKELPSLEMPNDLRDQVGQLCTKLIGTKHDLIHETFEIEEAIIAGLSMDIITNHVKHIQDWITDDISSIDQCVGALNEAAKSGTVSFIVAMLVMESAANILNTTPAWPAISVPEE